MRSQSALDIFPKNQGSASYTEKNELLKNVSFGYFFREKKLNEIYIHLSIRKLFMVRKNIFWMQQHRFSIKKKNNYLIVEQLQVGNANLPHTCVRCKYHSAKESAAERELILLGHF